MERLQLTVGIFTLLTLVTSTPRATSSSLHASVIAESLLLLLPAQRYAAIAELVCTECITEEIETCVVNNSYVGRDVSLINCPGNTSVCFTHTALDKNETILTLSRGCANISSNGSSCSYESHFGLNYISCYCYCHQSNCTVITNSSDVTSLPCLSAIPIPTIPTTPNVSSPTTPNVSSPTTPNVSSPTTPHSGTDSSQKVKNTATVGLSIGLVLVTHLVA